MNVGQKIVLALGLLGIVVTGLFPPWSVSCFAHEKIPPARQLEYTFIFNPPSGANARTCSVSLDGEVLLTIWAVVLAITFMLALLLSRRRTT